MNLILNLTDKVRIFTDPLNFTVQKKVQRKPKDSKDPTDAVEVDADGVVIEQGVEAWVNLGFYSTLENALKSAFNKSLIEINEQLEAAPLLTEVQKIHDTIKAFSNITARYVAQVDGNTEEGTSEEPKRRGRPRKNHQT
jgi:hypothetical protein